MKYASLFVFIILAVFSVSVSSVEKDPTKKETVSYLKAMFDRYGSCTTITGVSGTDNKKINELPFHSFESYAAGGIKIESGSIRTRNYTSSTERREIEWKRTFKIEDNQSVEIEPRSSEYKNDNCTTILKIQCADAFSTSDSSTKCFNESVSITELNRSGEINRENYSREQWLSVFFLSATTEQANKIKSALQHYWGLHGKELVDETFDEDVF